MDRIEQRLRVARNPLPQRAEDEGNSPSGRHAPRDVFLHSLGPGDALPDADAAIFSILPILAILSCCFAVTPEARLVRQILS